MPSYASRYVCVLHGKLIFEVISRGISLWNVVIYFFFFSSVLESKLNHVSSKAFVSK